MDNTILQMEGITKIFPGVKALDKVRLELKAGEVHALIGENGAGKSTLMKVLLGIYKPEAGTITFKGEEVRFHSPHDALRNGISMIHQEISLIPTMTIAENIWLGQEKSFLKMGLIDYKARYQATRDLFVRLGIDLNPRLVVKILSIAQMQLVEIARAVSFNSDIIIMDEPTSALTDVEVALLYRIIRDLVAKKVTIIFISHKLEEIFEICDRVTVFRDGQYIDTLNCKDTTKDSLITMIVGRELTQLFPRGEVEIAGTVMEVKGLSRVGVFNNINFEVRQGEILGFSGLMGAGRTEIMRAIFGIDLYDRGKIYIDGKLCKIRHTRDAVRAGIGMVTEDRLRLGVIYALSVMANITIANFFRICLFNFFRRAKEVAIFEESRKALEIKCASPGQLISQLSGGNQQKAIIARWLLTKPKVLILDEPTRGIDVGSKAEIHRLIGNLAKQGMAIVLISSEMPEIIGMSDRILVVRQGEIVYEGKREDVSQEILITHAFGT